MIVEGRAQREKRSSFSLDSFPASASALGIPRECSYPEIVPLRRLFVVRQTGEPAV
jgi:hypothetical protein